MENSMRPSVSRHRGPPPSLRAPSPIPSPRVERDGGGVYDSLFTTEPKAAGLKLRELRNVSLSVFNRHVVDNGVTSPWQRDDAVTKPPTRLYTLSAALMQLRKKIRNADVRAFSLPRLISFCG